MRKIIYNLATDKSKGFIAGLAKFILFLLSLVYGLVIRILIFLNRLKQKRLNCKVISVGNITLGGTGKTTLVEYIACFLKEHGRKVAILSRGYKRKKGEAGDEPFMLSEKLKDIPVIVNANRIKGARQARELHGVDTLILDDGFQQWKLKKDLEIVSIDAINPFGNRSMIPRGILREPLSSLKRADIFIITKTNLSKDVDYVRRALEQINPESLTCESIHKPLSFYCLSNPREALDVYGLEGKPAVLFSGIGDPDSFEKLIKILGINIALTFRFDDHHNYTLGDLEKIFSDAKAKGNLKIITTQKDAARLSSLALAQDLTAQILVLNIGLVITKEQKEFHDRLLKLYSL